MMLSKLSLIALCLALFAGVAPAQDAPETGEAPTADDTAAPEAAPKTDATTDKTDKTEAGGSQRVVKSKTKTEIKVLKPQDVPAELTRLNSLRNKADIKAELTVMTSSGRPVAFKGVIRNGKLIERIIKRRFVPQKNLEHPHCGVRIWWSGGSAGYIFFRYSTIKTLAITGQLTAKERREIMARLRGGNHQTEAEKIAAAALKLEESIGKMSPDELQAFMVRKYPYDKGWDHKRMRALKRKQLIENKVLTREEALFVKHFPVLVEAHFEALKRNTKKIEIAPGSQKKPEDDSSGDEPTVDDRSSGDAR